MLDELNVSPDSIWQQGSEIRKALMDLHWPLLSDNVWCLSSGPALFTVILSCE